MIKGYDGYHIGMALVRFTANLHRHLASPPPEAKVAADSVRTALQRVFDQRPDLRGYIIDEQGLLRRHIAVFVDGVPVRDRTELSDAVGPDTQIDVMQALSGG